MEAIRQLKLSLKRYIVDAVLAPLCGGCFRVLRRHYQRINGTGPRY